MLFEEGIFLGLSKISVKRNQRHNVVQGFSFEVKLQLLMQFPQGHFQNRHERPQYPSFLDRCFGKENFLLLPHDSASMQYPLRCSHVLGNFRVLTDSATMITIKSNFQAIVYYQEQTLFAGTYTHQLRRLDNGYEIVEKRVDLINCDADHRSILIYL